jgi:hypothetical protein
MSWNVFFVFYEAYQMLTHYVSQPRINARKNQSPRKDMLFLPKKYILQVCLRMLFDSFWWDSGRPGLSWAVLQPKMRRLTRPLQQLTDPAQGRE